MTEVKKVVKRTVGLDAHPDSFTAAIVVGYIPDEAIVEKVSDAIALKHMEGWFERYVPKDAVVVLEASGNSFAIYERLCAIGYRTLVLDSEQVGKIAKSYCDTDKISAVRLARSYLTGLSGEVWVPDPLTRQRREVFGAYQRSVTDCTRHTNRIKGTLNEYTIRLKKGEKKLTSSRARERVFQAREWSAQQRVLLEEAFDDLNRANCKRARLRKMMAAEVVNEPQMLQLVRIFGISVITAYGLIAMIGEPGRFLTPKKLSAYFGLSPKLKKSGKTARLGGISKKGRRDIRALLVQSAHTVLQHKSKSNPLYSWAWRTHLRKGRNIATVAVARKIAVAIWYLLMGKPFNARERSDTLKRKLRGLAKELGQKHVRDMGFRTYNLFITHHLQLLENYACKGGHT